jgi:hypothetical protein
MKKPESLFRRKPLFEGRRKVPLLLDLVFLSTWFPIRVTMTVKVKQKGQIID